MKLRHGISGVRSSRSVKTAAVLAATVALGATSALAASSASVSSGPVTGAPGSLPLKGDKEVAGDGADPNATVYGTASHWNVLNFGPGNVATTPMSNAFNYVDSKGVTQRRIMVTTSSNQDVGSAAASNNLSVSDDGGLTFLNTVRGESVQAQNAARLPDGSLMSPEFIPIWGDAAHTFSNLKVRRSTDGKNWGPVELAPVENLPGHRLGPMSNGMRVAGNPITLPDGTIVIAAYTAFVGEKQNGMLLQTTDGGKTWKIRSILPTLKAAPNGANEAGLSMTTDGRMVAVIRTIVPNRPDGSGPPPALVTSFSDDLGKTWSEAVPTLGPDGEQIAGVQPILKLQANGTLLMSTGRPDVRMYVSYDGTGRTWDVQQTVFANYPSEGHNGRWDGSSGNNSLNTVTANRSVLFYDQCAPWGCGAYNEQPGASAQYVAAVTKGTGLIDVASRLRDGTAGITGEFAPANKAFPEMRPSGAFDGSADAGAEAQLASTPRGSSMVISLDRAYRLNRIGLMLGHGQPQSATVQLSADGKNWGRPVVQRTDSVDYAMRYTDFAATPAKYVRITGAKQAVTTISEMQLYSADVNGFENELPFSVPRGWTDAKHAWVTDVPGDVAYAEFGGYHSKTALRLWDKYTDSNAHISLPAAASKQRKLNMQWGTSDARAPFDLTVNGVGADGKALAAWTFRILTPPGGKPQQILANNGAGWQQLGTLTAAIVSRTYVPVTVDAGADSATLSVNGQSFSTTVKAGAASELTGLSFATGDPETYGGIYFLDDVTVSG